MHNKILKVFSPVIYLADLALIAFLAGRIGAVLTEFQLVEDVVLVGDNVTVGDVIGFGIAALFFLIMVFGCFYLVDKPKEQPFGQWFSELNLVEAILVLSLLFIPFVEVGLIAASFFGASTGAFAALAPVDIPLSERIIGYSFGLAIAICTFFCASFTAQSLRQWSNRLEKEELQAYEDKVKREKGNE